jgi:hypothetical protein
MSPDPIALRVALRHALYVFVNSAALARCPNSTSCRTRWSRRPSVVGTPSGLRPGKKGQSHNDSTIRAFYDSNSAYLDNWDALGLTLVPRSKLPKGGIDRAERDPQRSI